MSAPATSAPPPPQQQQQRQQEQTHHHHTDPAAAAVASKERKLNVNAKSFTPGTSASKSPPTAAAMTPAAPLQTSAKPFIPASAQGAGGKTAPAQAPAKRSTVPGTAGSGSRTSTPPMMGSAQGGMGAPPMPMPMPQMQVPASMPMPGMPNYLMPGSSMMPMMPVPPPGMPMGPGQPGMFAPGMMPPGTMPPGTMPPGTMPPGMMPPGMMPPGMMPPGMMPPGMMPPGMMPPGMMPPGMMPPGMMPPGMMPPGMMPPLPPPPPPPPPPPLSPPPQPQHQQPQLNHQPQQHQQQHHHQQHQQHQQHQHNQPQHQQYQQHHHQQHHHQQQHQQQQKPPHPYQQPMDQIPPQMPFPMSMPFPMPMPLGPMPPNFMPPPSLAPLPTPPAPGAMPHPTMNLNAAPSGYGAPVAAPPATVMAAAGVKPPTPAAALPPPVPARVSVGNASLAALHSKEPPKFSCVLLSGLPAVGKTTLGRELVNSLKADGMGWAFFSGADYLAEASTRRTFWDTTKEVFDALSKRLDELLEQQKQHRDIKGLVIDKNCKGIEDIYYLSALLKAKQIPFVGIVGMECDDDKILLQRMGGDEYLRERLKYHRVIHARVISLAKMDGMYRYVDATRPKEEVVQSLRTMVLGCCAQPPVRGIRTHHYDESRANAMVDSYTEYSQVMTTLFERVAPGKYQFPCATEFMPFSTKEMTEKNRVNSLKSRYGVRRKVDGQRYILVYVEKKLYLVPPHMRAVLQVSPKGWLGANLDTVGGFVLEGDLARLTRERQKEKFLVYDAQFWSEADRVDVNVLLRMTWSERQAFLASNLAAEETAFHPPETDCIVVHHATQKLSSTVDLLESEEYPSSGLVFQPITQMQRGDHVLVWRQPASITVDFRVGPLLGVKEDAASAASAQAVAAASPSSPPKGRRGSLDAFADQPTRVFALEVYDKAEKRYEQFENATVEVRHPDVVEGCIVTCSLTDEARHTWLFNRIRYDVLRPDYKHEVDDILSDCLVPRAKLVSWLAAEHIVDVEIPRDGSIAAAGGAMRADGAVADPTNLPPPPSYGQATAALNASGGLPPPPPPPPPVPPPGAVPAAAPGPGLPAVHYPTASTMLSTRPTAAVSPPPGPPPPLPPPPAAANPAQQIKMLASMVPSLHVVRSNATAEKPTPGAAQTANANHREGGVRNAEKPVAGRKGRGDDKGDEPPLASCAQCHTRKPAKDLRVDRRNRKAYCHACWAEIGWDICKTCGDFNRGSTGSQGRFTCYKCGKAGDGTGVTEGHPRGSKRRTPNESRSSETKAAEPKAAEPKAAEPKAAEPKAADTKAAETKTAEVKPAEPKPAEPKAVDTKAAEPKAANDKEAASKAAEKASSPSKKAKVAATGGDKASMDSPVSPTGGSKKKASPTSPKSPAKAASGPSSPAAVKKEAAAPEAVVEPAATKAAAAKPSAADSAPAAAPAAPATLAEAQSTPPPVAAKAEPEEKKSGSGCRQQ